LQTLGLCRRFGALAVTDDVNFSLAAGERRALIGPNGAGKTTFVNLLTGRLAPSAGIIRLAGVDITTTPAHRRVRLGLARTFQLNTLLRKSTVLENVQLAILQHEGSAWHLFGGATRQRRAAESAYALLQQIGLARHASDRVGTLAYGRQRLVEIAIALALRPKVLLLDEPAAGVPPADMSLVLNVLRDLPRDIAVLIIEHDMKLVFDFADQISVLVNGRLLIEGTPAAIAADPQVQEVYLGRRHHA
jgi:branched-chain amino acid transport system ATP-binding protein